MSGGFPPATAASISVGPDEPMFRTVTFIPVSFSKGFNAVAKPVASPPENSFQTDTVPPIFFDVDATADPFDATMARLAMVVNETAAIRT
jgi:hypothetical protein